MTEPKVSLGDAYAEACQALGETVVAQRILTRQLEAMAAENERLRATETPEREVT